MTTASLTVCQSQASSAATSDTVRPPPTWAVAHLAALVVSRQSFGRYSVIREHPGLHGALAIDTAHPVLLPGQRHGHPIDGKVHVVHDGAIFDLGPAVAPRTVDDPGLLLDHQRHVRTTTLIGDDANVLQAHQGMEDLTRVGKDEGASSLLAHTTMLKRLRLCLEDPQKKRDPANFR